MPTKTDDIDMSTSVELEIAPPTATTPNKVLLYGVEGIGKTTLASRFPNPIFIDLEGSTVKMKPQPKRLPDVNNYSEFKRLLGQVLNTRHEYKTLVIDSLSWLDEMVAEYVCAQDNAKSIEDFGYGKGYKLVEEEFNKLLGFLDRLLKERQMHIVLIAHSIIRQTTEPGNAIAFDRYELNLSKRVAPLMKQWADCVLFANYKTIVVEGSKGEHTHAIGGKDRVLYCSHTATIDAKNRFGLPDTIQMTIDALKPIFE